MFKNLFSQGGLSLDRLRSFLEMAEAGSIAKAAPGDLNRQSLMSRQLRDLEEFFGSELTVRRGKSLALSANGKRLATLVREQFRDLSDFHKEQRDHPRSFRIGAGSSILEWLVVPAAGQVRAALEHASLALESNRSHEVIEGIRDGRLDFGLVREDAVPERLPRRQVVKLGFHICAHRSLMGGKTVAMLKHPERWNRLPWVLGDGRGQFDQRLRKTLSTACGSFTPTYECNSLLQVRAMIESGTAVGVLPSIGLQGLAEKGVAIRSFAPLDDYGRHQVLHWNERQMSRRGIDSSAIRAVAEALARRRRR